MPPWVIDFTIVLITLGMTYALMSEGLWGAALMTFNVMFAGLIAFNFYEPIAAWMAGQMAEGGTLAGFADVISLVVLFAVSLVALRLTTESIAPAMVRFPAPVYHLGRIIFAVLGAAITTSILLLAFHVSPVHKKVFGVIHYNYKPPFQLGLDHRWLAFFQFTTGQVFASYGSGETDPHGEYGDAKVFDPYGDWLINHQNARPYGPDSDKVPPPPEQPAADAGGGGGEQGGGTPAGPGGGRGGPGGGPGAQGAADNAPRVPGGTAGAAVGLAPQ